MRSQCELWIERQEVRTLGNHLPGGFGGVGRLDMGEKEHRGPWDWGQTGLSLGRAENRLCKTTHFRQKYKTHAEIFTTSQRGRDLDWDGVDQTAYTKGARILCDM